MDSGQPLDSPQFKDEAAGTSKVSPRSLTVLFVFLEVSCLVKSALSRKGLIVLAAVAVLLAAGVAYATQQFFDVAIQGDVLLSVTAEDPLLVYSGDGMTPIDSGDTVDFGTVEVDYWGTGPIPSVKVLVVNTSQTPEQVVVIGDGGNGIVPVFGPTMDDMVPAPDNSFVLQPEGEPGDSMWGYVGLTFPEPTEGSKSTTIIFRATDEIAPVPDPTPTPLPEREPVVDRLNVATLIQIETSDPVNAVGENAQNLPMYEALLRYNEQGLLEPMLAERWSVTPDAQSWTFNLRQGVQFHKGFGEFTAEDVIHTNERHAREGIRDGTHQGFFRDQVVGNQLAPDDYTVVFNLPDARIDMDEVMSSKWHNLILSKAHFDAEGQDGVENNPIGTNAYQYVERSSGEYILFERVPFEHHRVTSDFPELQILFVTEAATRLAMLLTGEAHMTTLPPDLEAAAVGALMRVISANDPTLTLMACLCGQFKETVPWGSRLGENPDLPYSDIFHDVTEVPWTNRKVREALNRAINREELNATLLAGRGQPMYVPNYHPTLRGFNPDWETKFQADYGYDPNRARELLEEVEAEIGQPLDWSQVVLASTNKLQLPVQVAMSEAIHNYLLEIGADITIDSEEYATWRPHLFNNTIGGVLWPNVSSKFGDPDMLRILFCSPFVCCHFYESDAIDALYVQLQGDGD